jgi:hypothetical protein
MPDAPAPISPEALVAALQAFQASLSGGGSSAAQPAAAAPLTDEALAALAAQDSVRHLAALATRFGAPTNLPLSNLLVLRSGQNVDPSPSNPVPRPACEFGEWFDVQDTASGSNVAQALGPRSGYFAEYSNWAPVVSYLFDLQLRFIAVTASPDVPDAIRAAYEPLVTLLSKVTNLAVATLAVRRTQAKHVNTPLSEAYKSLHTNIQLRGTAALYATDLETENSNLIRQQIQKSSIKAQAENAARSRRSGRGQDQRGGTQSEGGFGSGQRGRGRGRGQGQGRGRGSGGSGSGAGQSGNPFADA